MSNSALYYFTKLEDQKKIFDQIMPTLQKLGFELIEVKKIEDLPKNKSVIRFQKSGPNRLKMFYHSNEKNIDAIIENSKNNGIFVSRKEQSIISTDLKISVLGLTKGYNEILNILKLNYPDKTENELIEKFEQMFNQDGHNIIKHFSSTGSYIERKFEDCIFGKQLNYEYTTLYDKDNFYIEKTFYRNSQLVLSTIDEIEKLFKNVKI
jgi:hypothetical protein